MRFFLSDCNPWSYNNFDFRHQSCSDTRSHIRLLSTPNPNNDQQRLWSQQVGSFWAKTKRSVPVALPIHRRHNKEFQLSSAVNMGTFPSRLCTIFLSFYLHINLLYCCPLDYWHQPRAALLAEARSRNGHLAVINIFPLLVFSARNNPFVLLLGISFDTFNLFHHWVGSPVAAQSLAHTIFWGINNYDARGLDRMSEHFRTDSFLTWGLVAMVAIVSLSYPTSNYESFLHIH